MDDDTENQEAVARMNNALEEYKKLEAAATVALQQGNRDKATALFRHAANVLRESRQTYTVH